MRTYIIDGSSFSDIEGFYSEVDRIMTKELGFKTGHNLNAFRDILYGGLGAHAPEEPFVIKWIHYDKSRQDLGDSVMLAVLDTIADHDNSGYDCKLEIYR
ncbi:barstar family protein [uncultured Ruminococcus sp.]|uniref:barstar family protein n=1 Tax=uncultured Ruminococcus sp. TaxID=165186 RepID=UPI00260429EE|nr:barstar family protein [uncultured Ruminococcus sp.]